MWERLQQKHTLCGPERELALTTTIKSRAELDREGRDFRRAIEVWIALHPGVNLSTNVCDPERGRFPLDCCKATSLMFGQHLLPSVGAARLHLVNGVRDGESHLWLQCDEFYVDLTADQFDDQDEQVLVVPVDSCEWHSTFRPWSVWPFELRKDHAFVQYADEVSKLM